MAEPDFESVHNELRAFVAERAWDAFHAPKDLAMSVAIEAAELLEVFQWRDLQAGDITAGDRSRISHEIADVMLYCMLLADKVGLDIPRALHEKIAMNREKYPVSKAHGRADKYDRR
jgi:NTP pyrophosphatase (non-canonical NTP hydrolase)